VEKINVYFNDKSIKYFDVERFVIKDNYIDIREAEYEQVIIPLYNVLYIERHL
jgi:hypothetical protein